MSNSRTFRPDFSGWKRFSYKAHLSAVTALCFTVLTACGPLSSSPSSSQSSSSAAPTHSAITVPGATTTNIQTSSGMPALTPKGVNVDQLFAQDIRDPLQRVKRVENAVLDLRRELDAVMPSIIRLASVESDIQDLIVQLESMVNGDAPQPAARPMEYVDQSPLSPPAGGPAYLSGAPEAPTEIAVNEKPSEQAVAATQTMGQGVEHASGQPAPLLSDDLVGAESVPAKVAAPLPVSPSTPPSANNAAALKSNHSTNATALRVGAHSDKTRLVIDLSGPATYSQDLDNNEKILIVELPGTGWTGKRSQSFSDPVIASYTVEDMDGGSGSRLILQLKVPTSVIYEKSLPAEGGAGNRIVLDLKK